MNRPSKFDTHTVGVAHHPAKEAMAQLWEAWARAAEINMWLRSNDFPEVNRGTLGKYGQKHWNKKVDLHWDDDPTDRLSDALTQLEADGNEVLKTSFVQKAYPGWVRDSEGTQALSRDVKSTTVSVTLAPKPKFDLERAQATNVSLGYKPPSKPSTVKGWMTGVILPDMQIGYRQDRDALVSTHDEVAIDIAHQIVASVQATEGVDLLINLGDNLDLPAFSNHRSAPGYVKTTQFALDRASQEAAIQRQLAPNARIVWLEGNHECLSEDTLAYTPDGLKRWDELKVGDLVYSAGDDLTLEELPIRAIHVYDHSGPMVHFGGTVDMLLTENHRVVGLDPVSFAQGKVEWIESFAGDAERTVIPAAGIITLLSGTDTRRVDYRGKVWCLTVDNGRFYAKRGGPIFLTGNSRLTNTLTDRMPSLLGITQAGSSDPVLSIPYLCRFDDYNVEYVAPYPDSAFWVNDRFMVVHGDKYSSSLGGTARNQLSKGVSVAYGHIHRSELLWDRRRTRSGSVPVFAGSPGCLCKITGQVPSAKTGITAEGKQADSQVENWQQGIWVFKYQDGGDNGVFVEPVQFESGHVIFRGQSISGRDRVDGG